MRRSFLNIRHAAIPRFDIFKGNLPLYHVDRVIRETADNGFEEVCINANVRDDSEVSELFFIFKENSSNIMTG